LRLGFDLSGKRVLVVGLARTGVVTSLFSAGYGATVTATDERPELDLGETAAQLRAAGVKLELGGHVDASFLEQDLIVVSPGVSAKLPPLELARAHGIPVWSEIELAWRYLRGKLVAITGSNGKTTTTALVAHILQTSIIPTLVGGNIGTPLLALVERSTDPAVTVAEISSFQLETIDKFRPEIGVLLNLTPDHLDRHGTFEVYAHAKMRMFENQLERDIAVLNADDPLSGRLVTKKPQVFWFSRKERVNEGAFLQDEGIFVAHKGKQEFVMKRGDISLPGAHNVENVLAAVTAARLVGVDAATIAGAVKSFAGVEHRLEFVAEVRGVRYYNDSKATNVDATLKALDSFPGRILIILGGKDKGSDYRVLQQPLREKAILALLIGSAAEKIESQIHGSVAMERAGTLDRAVELAAQAARPGDVVLLAPACASFDQFENYEQRGRVFKELVRGLTKKSTGTSSGKG
jgi:UDP-N-acetylmuramoylalanine--D-glutamate ligase